jgi:hypothetical protein
VVFEGLGVAGEEVGGPDAQDVLVGSQGPFPGNALGGFRLHAELFAQFTDKGPFGGLAGLDLTAGSLGYSRLSLRYAFIPELCT